MKISYKKLWHLLIDRGLNKQDLRRMTGISTASIAKLGKGENITTDILVKICEALDCDVTDISAFAYGITTTSWALLVFRAQYMDFIGHI